MKIALIGAGAAGAACISVLRDRGIDVSIFEKARGAGGRLATRRVTLTETAQVLHYDHGASFFTMTSSTTPECLEALKQQGIIQQTNAGLTSCPNMPQMVKQLLGHSIVHFNTEVQSLERLQNKWFVKATVQSMGQKNIESFGPFDKLIITAPAPQAAKIIADTPCSWRDDLKLIQYKPCWVLMLSIHNRQQTSIPKNSSIISSLIPQHSKPGRNFIHGVEMWVAQASPDWSLVNIDKDKNIILEELLIETLEILSTERSHVLHADVHRWRYSQVDACLGRPALFDENNHIYYAGDGCLGTGVEGAIVSGVTVGQSIAK
jgi:predicted NAD/FAD-dependent oxidoreductase